MNIYHDITSHTLLTCNHNEGAGKQVIIMNYIWLICILANCLMFEGSFGNFDSSKYDHSSLQNQRLEQKLSSWRSHD